MNMDNLIGKKFGKLLVLNVGSPVIEKDGKKSKRMLCLCDCGNQKEIRAKDIKRGTSKSCGCLREIRDADGARLSTAKRIFVSKYNDGNLTFENFLTLSQQNCHYCGQQPSNTTNEFNRKLRSSERARNGGYFTYNGLDRVDSNKSHDLDNVVPCCKWCNYAKRERSVEDFKNWIEKVYNFICKD